MFAAELGRDLVKNAALPDEQLSGKNRFAAAREFLRRRLPTNVVAGPYPEALKLTPPEVSTVIANATALPFRGVVPFIGGAAGGVTGLRLLQHLQPKPPMIRGIGAAIGGSILGSILAKRYMGEP
jgi:hypothetical protein